MATRSQKSVQNKEDVTVEQLLWGYLHLKRDLSQRALSKLVSQKAKSMGESISLESVQRAFSQETGASKKLIQKIILQLFRDHNMSANKAKNYALQNAEEAKNWFSFVSAKDFQNLVTFWQTQSHQKSKRWLASELVQRLEQQGFTYHVGSIQNILGGKIAETKNILVISLRQHLIDNHFGSEDELNKALAQFNKVGDDPFELVASDRLHELCDHFLNKHQSWSKRKLAIALSEDLAAKGYQISFNSLQYALAGKRKRVKKIIQETLEKYMDELPIQTKGIQQMNLNARTSHLENLYQRVQQAGNNKILRRQVSNNFLTAREVELRRMWLARKSRRASSASA